MRMNAHYERRERAGPDIHVHACVRGRKTRQANFQEGAIAFLPLQKLAEVLQRGCRVVAEWQEH